MNFTVEICKCGHIHFISMEDIADAAEHNNAVLFICAHCGAATVIGADIGYEYSTDGNKTYNMYEHDFSPYTTSDINSDDYERVVYSRGISVPMLNGNYADTYFAGKFRDSRTPDYSELFRLDCDNIDKVHSFIYRIEHDAATVNMDRFINQTPDKYLQEISKYPIQGFNWAGTKYEKLEHH